MKQKGRLLEYGSRPPLSTPCPHRPSCRHRERRGQSRGRLPLRFARSSLPPRGPPASTSSAPTPTLSCSPEAGDLIGETSASAEAEVIVANDCPPGSPKVICPDGTGTAADAQTNYAVGEFEGGPLASGAEVRFGVDISNSFTGDAEASLKADLIDDDGNVVSTETRDESGQITFSNISADDNVIGVKVKTRATASVTGPEGATASASASLTSFSVVGAGSCEPTGQPPVAVDDGDEVSVCVATTTTAINVTANDIDPDGDNAALAIAPGSVQNSTDQEGTAIAINDDEISYSPPLTLPSEPDTFTYQVQDPDENVSNAATVSVDVQEACGNVTVKLQSGGGLMTDDDASGGQVSFRYDVDDDDDFGVGETFSLNGGATQSFNLPLYQEENLAAILTNAIVAPNGYEINLEDSFDKDTELDDIPGFDDDFPNDPTRSNLGLDFSGPAPDPDPVPGGGSCDASTLIASISAWSPSMCSQSVNGGISSKGGNCTVQAHQWRADTVQIVPHSLATISGSPSSRFFSLSGPSASGNIELRLQDQEGDWGPWQSEFASCN